MKEKLLEHLDAAGFSRIKDKQTFEQFVQTMIEEDISLSDVYGLYDEFYDFVKSIWDLAHEE